jgi:cytosine/adenosine deaminase-related metal-dependent hydrolase
VPRLVLLPDAIADAQGTRPGHALLLDLDGRALTVLGAGPREHVSAPDAATVRLPDRLLIPGLVNAHAHLDLTALGPTPYDRDAGFHAWLDHVRAARETLDAPASVAEGVRRSLGGGVVALADIAGSDLTASIQLLRDSPLDAVVFAELFGLGERQSAALTRVASIADAFDPDARVRLGLQPHAPYSAGPTVYAAVALHARERGLPVSTHLAESRAERTLVAAAEGPLRGLLESLGLWTPEAAAHFGRHPSPVRALADDLPGAGWILAHVNDCADEDLPLLAEAGATVAYCPRASAYFHHPEDLGPHRFRDMLDAGVNVALGTDSVLNLPPDQADRLSPLDDARLLHRTTGAGDVLLPMLTTRGARALRLDEARFRFDPGPLAGLVAIDLSGTDPALDPWTRALRSDAPPEPLFPAPTRDAPAALQRLAARPDA